MGVTFTMGGDKPGRTSTSQMFTRRLREAVTTLGVDSERIPSRPRRSCLPTVAIRLGANMVNRMALATWHGRSMSLKPGEQ
eukprot:2066370-Karenia_brevis.AAC.1